MSVVKDKWLIGFAISVANLRQAMESGVPVVFKGVKGKRKRSDTAQVAQELS